VPLSEEELRLLEQMERALVADDPKLASTMRGASIRRHARRRAYVAGGAFLVGVIVLMTGAVMSMTIVGIVGFVVMLSAATIGVTALRNPAMMQHPMRDTRHAGFGVVDGGRAHRPKIRGLRRPHSSSSGSFMDRMEERWQRRRERGL
jgi:hypothetical protein